MKRTVGGMAIALAVAGAPVTLAEPVPGGTADVAAYHQGESGGEGAWGQPGLAPVTRLGLAGRDRDRTAAIGYWLNRHVGVTGGFIDLDDLGAAGGMTDSGTDFGAGGVEPSGGFTASALGRLPLSQRVSLFGKAGAYQWHTDFEAGDASRFDAGSGGVLGVGAEFQLGRAGALWGVRAEWQRYLDVDERDAADGSDLDFATIGLTAHY